MYEIRLGKELKVGDVVIYNSKRMTIKEIFHGCVGAGSFDYGIYIPVSLQSTPNNTSWAFESDEEKCWFYVNCPYVVEVVGGL